MRKLFSVFMMVIVILISFNSSFNSLAKDTIKMSSQPQVNKIDSASELESIIDNINESTLRYYLEKILEYPYRVTGSDACENAGTFIYGEFEKMGIDVEYQTWESEGKVWKPIAHYENFKGKNVIATIPGNSMKPMTYIFSAHYDSAKISPGALDNGAGVAALLTIAKELCKYNFNHTIKFIAFSGEEQGLLGSYAYAKKVYDEQEKIIGVINVDQIGNNSYNKDEPLVIMAYATQPVKWIGLKIDEICKTYDLGTFIGFRNYHGNSDDKSFDDYGFGAMQLYQASTGISGGGADDDINLVNFSYLTKVTKAIAGGLAKIAELPGIDPFINIEFPKEDTKYIDGKIYGEALSKGETKVRGNITIKVNVESNNPITKVVFELIKGQNEDEIGDGRPIVYTYTDNITPYNWTLGYNFSGWHTIRTTVYTDKGSSCDEIEIYFGCSKSSSQQLYLHSIYESFKIKFPIITKFIGLLLN